DPYGKAFYGDFDGDASLFSYRLPDAGEDDVTSDGSPDSGDAAEASAAPDQAEGSSPESTGVDGSPDATADAEGAESADEPEDSGEPAAGP
ncbi:glycogen debranching enzyme GlgX, partial [Klebsiella pneumoniae]|nr:glycogen debranching enzyme GlgX [Klebsiella pneumoniae]